jgi:CO/xanthine dehydrogenase FAD-binding subunit
MNASTSLIISEPQAVCTSLLFHSSPTTYQDGQWCLAVGARPQRAIIAQEGSRYLSAQGSNPSQENIAEAAAMASRELIFGTNMRASGEYRREICSVLLQRAVQEVLA